MEKTLHHFSDHHLIEQFKAGNQSAISELIRRYQSNVYTSIYYLVQDKYIAEDIYQDTFIKVIHHLQKSNYQEQGKFLPWIQRIAHNLCIDHFRKLKNHMKYVVSNGDEAISYLRSNNTEHKEFQLIKKETESKIEQLIDELPLEQKEVVILRIYGELSFKEIADATGVSINTALGRMRYALHNIRKIIHERKIELK